MSEYPSSRLLQRIGQRFSRSAKQYDAHARLQQHVMQHAFEQANARFSDTDHILDIGCGTGNFSRYASSKHKGWDLSAIDIAQGMCVLAAPHYQNIICADMTDMPYGDASFDGVFSSLAIQWVNDIEPAAHEMFRVLRYGGYAVITTFLEQTLCELREASTRAGMKSVVPMKTQEAYAELFTKAGFEVQKIERWQEVHHVPAVETLMAHLRAIGATNPHPPSTRGLSGAKAFANMLAHYERLYYDPRGLAVTWDMGMFILQKPYD